MICWCGADEKQLGLAENRRKAENEAEMEGKAGDGAGDCKETKDEDGTGREQSPAKDHRKEKKCDGLDGRH